MKGPHPFISNFLDCGISMNTDLLHLDRINLEIVEWPWVSPQDLVGGLRSAAAFIGLEWHNQ